MPDHACKESLKTIKCTVTVIPQTYLADVLERIVSGRTKSHQLHELLAWNWKAAQARTVQVAA